MIGFVKAKLTRFLERLLLAIGISSVVAPVRAQTYDPNYPVCLQVYGLVNYYDCHYTSLPQCAQSAQALSAQCIVNPYYAGAYRGTPSRPYQYRRKPG
jgi:hypothetical protein